MKVFQKQDPEGWESKVNFVDDNNLLVGYDMDDICCEVFGWYIADEVAVKQPMEERKVYSAEELAGFQFDPSYFKQDGEGDDWYYDSYAIFRLVNGGKQLFLHLYNSHNGYYFHGFEFKDGDRIIKDGSL